MKAILFDLQGTLIENGVYPSPVKQTKYALHIEGSFDEFIVKFERAFMTAQFPSLTDALHHVCEDFEIQVPEYVIEKLVGVWNKNKLLSILHPEVLESLADLRKDYKLILLANSDCFSKEVIEKFALQQHVDVVFLSCDTGLLKADTEFFLRPLRELGIDPTDALMVGDSIESDMEGAKQAGIKSVLYDVNNRREYPDKITSLAQLRPYIENHKQE